MSGLGISLLTMIVQVKKVMSIRWPWKRGIQAIILSIPFLITLPWMDQITMNSPISILALLVFCTYALIVQVILSRQWLWKRIIPQLLGSQ